MNQLLVVEGNFFEVFIFFELTVGRADSLWLSKPVLVSSDVRTAAQDAVIRVARELVAAVVIEQANCTMHCNHLIHFEVEEVQVRVNKVTV